MTEFSLALTTTLAPAKKFTIDAVEYELLGIDHISQAEEAEVMAFFARHDNLSVALARESEVARGTGLALKMQDTRKKLLTKMTTVPLEVIEKLPLTEQTKLMEAIQKEIEGEEES